MLRIRLTGLQTQLMRFKPLQNGAVLCWVLKSVDICEIRQRFKPLQNGAVLCCSGGRMRARPGGTLVSNPFRTGRYCAG